MLDVVICTFNRANDLDLCLAALGRQQHVDVEWQVTVVDNNCSDRTPEVVETHAAMARIPAVRRIVEHEQGLTPARLRGIRESTSAFVAFVDDDCLVATDWVAEAMRFARSHPAAGAFGGRVILNWGRRPSAHLRRHGWLFAEQDLGNAPHEVQSLVGTGLVLNRQALHDVGWVRQPLLADRVGRGYASGGDVEISVRLVASGWTLWYAPPLRLEHRIPASRQRLSAMHDLARGLGAGAELADLLVAKDADEWHGAKRRLIRSEARAHLHALRSVAKGEYNWRDWIVRRGFIAGQRAQTEALEHDPILLRHLAGACARPG